MKTTQPKRDTYLAKFLILLATVSALFFMVHQVTADVIEYCDVDGDTVSFKDIIEVSFEASPLFGQPAADQDKLLIPNFGFNSVASNSLDFHQGMMQMSVHADPGTYLNSVDLAEFGTYFLFGEGTTAAVHTSAFVIADGEIYDADSLFATAGTGTGNWSQDFSIAFPQTDEITLVIDSQIFAHALTDEVAFIGKGGMMISVNSISVVPEPAMVSGIASMLCIALMFGFRRKKEAILR